jgi:HlyD family secretion protein
MLSLLSACAPQTESEVAQSEEIVEVFKGDLSANATATGSLVAGRHVTLQAPATARVSAAYVRAGQSVVSGEPLAALDTTGAALDVTAAQLDVRATEAALASLLAEPAAAELAAAEAAVNAARTDLDDLLAGPTAAELASFEASLASAQASVASASADLSSAQSSVTAADMAAAEAALASAKIRLNQARERNEETTNQETHEALLAAEQAVAEAQARVDELRQGPDTSAAQSSVGAAAARLEASQADFAQQTAGPTAALLAQAEAQLASVEASLAELTADPTEAEIAGAEADLASARLALAAAKETLARLTIVAPFDGVVTAIHVQPGEIANGSVVELIDLDSLQVILQVDEVDVGSLAEGQEATITLVGFPGVTIPAEVAVIAAAPRSSASGGVAYDVRLDLTPTDLPLLAGMTADASLVTDEKRDVLLVPNAAVQVDRTNGAYSVRRVSADGAIEEVAITVGLRDADNTEVASGLTAGDRVLLGGAVPSGLQQEMGQGGTGFMLGGGN